MARDLRQFSPAAARNKQPILEVLQRVLPPRGHALEIASGTGEHAAHFAAGLPGWTWQPTEFDREAFASINAWRAFAGVINLLAPRQLDVTAPTWADIAEVDAIFCANMIHITPWTTCQGLMSGAGRYLVPRGLLVTYGPYLFDTEPNAPSNLAFDADLRARDPAWGVRSLAEVIAEAARAGLALRERVSMPANNLALMFQRKTD
jgi:Protein of unknown function (DUF938)